jgi:hypothetical protein
MKEALYILGIIGILALVIGNIVTALLDIEEMTYIEQVWYISNMNIFGKIVSTVILLAIFPIYHLMCWSYKFLHFIFNIKINK